jgi:hypothetical protein
MDTPDREAYIQRRRTDPAFDHIEYIRSRHLGPRKDFSFMTEHAAPQRAGVTHPHDKHGNPVRKGQLVEFVWAGEHHKGLVEEVSTDDHGTHRAHINITAVVPCTATSVREDENPKAAEKDGSKVTHKK